MANDEFVHLIARRLAETVESSCFDQKHAQEAQNSYIEMARAALSLIPDPELLLVMFEATLRNHVYSMDDYPSNKKERPFRVIPADEIDAIIREVRKRHQGAGFLYE